MGIYTWKLWANPHERFSPQAFDQLVREKKVVPIALGPGVGGSDPPTIDGVLVAVEVSENGEYAILSIEVPDEQDEALGVGFTYNINTKMGPGIKHLPGEKT